jgi:phospholipase D
MKKHCITLILTGFISTISMAYTFPADTSYQLCFTPGRNCTKMLTNRLKKASQQIDVQAYSFNSYAIIDSLIAAAKRGVIVNIIFDKSNFKSPYSQKLNRLKSAGIHIWKDDKPNIAHNKVMIIDHKIVETGSFNFTYSAQKNNAENMLIIDSTQLATQYEANWLRRQKVSKAIA